MIGKAIILCEYSGLVRDALTKLGWDATSVDILPTETEGKHIIGDAIKVISKPGFKADLLIGFPPCTYLTYAGMANWYDYGRAEKRIEAAAFFMKLYNAPVKHVCIENPQGIMAKIFREPDQIIHPYYFGDKDLKRTCLWLKNLPKLTYSLHDDLFNQKTATERPKPYHVGLCKKTGKTKRRYFTDQLMSGRFKTGKEKSKTFPSVAKAMAEQWTQYFIQSKQNN